MSALRPRAVGDADDVADAGHVGGARRLADLGAPRIERRDGVNLAIAARPRAPLRPRCAAAGFDRSRAASPSAALGIARLRAQARLRPRPPRAPQRRSRRSGGRAQLGDRPQRGRGCLAGASRLPSTSSVCASASQRCCSASMSSALTDGCASTCSIRLSSRCAISPKRIAPARRAPPFNVCRLRMQAAACDGCSGWRSQSRN